MVPMSALAWLAVAAAQAPSDAAPRAAQELVARFLSLLDDDLAAAAAMLSPDALFGAGDVGGPLTAENLPLRTLGCVEQDSPAVVEPFPPVEGGFVVSTDWLCPIEGTSTARAVRADFAVAGQRIEGVYFVFADSTVPWPPR